MAVILGIDPGSRITGYGVIRFEKQKATYIASGCIRTRGDDMCERLGQIYAGIEALISEHAPQQAAIEQVFVNKNVNSALKLGQARGAALAAVAKQSIAVVEYAPRQIKQAVTGYGAADKQQVMQMVCQLLKLTGQPQADAADALAIALCCGFSSTVVIG